jgi:hypothetical protein
MKISNFALGLGAFYLFTLPAYAKIDLRSLRLKITKPETAHSLTYESDDIGSPKTTFDLEPINNERLGIFLDFYGFLIGYSFDPFKSDLETKTTDIILSSEKFENSKFNLNFQILEGFLTESNDAFSTSRDKVYSPDTKSTKIEALGLHNLYTFKGKSLFNHFFRNRPLLSSKFSTGYSLVGSWSLRRLKLEDPNNIIFRADFFDAEPETFRKINAYSINASLGPMISLSVPNNFHLFAETKAGIGYFENLNNTQNLKRSGSEFIYSFGGGASWTSPNQKALINLKAWGQKGRHIETFFGDLTFIYFF